MTAADRCAYPAPRLGDRHHRPDPTGKLRDRPLLTASRVRLRVSPALSATRVGQLGAWLAVNLLARLEGLVDEVELDCPDASTHRDVRALMPGLHAQPELRDFLCDVAASAASKLVRVSTETAPVSAELILGGAEVRPDYAAANHIWSFGYGWLASVGHSPTVDRAHVIEEWNPLGMYLAVCYGVGEVFKVLKGSKSGESLAIDQLYASLWSGVHAACCQDLEDGPVVRDLILPPTYLVGAGAVGQATLLALITATGGAQSVTIVDGEQLDHTNRNRYVLTFEAEAADKLNKAEFAATVARSLGAHAFGVARHWQQYIERTSKPHPDPAMQMKEAALRYELILACVDKNRARHELQRTWPRDILGASTDGLRAQAVHYDMRTTTACLACHNPIPAFDQVLDRLRGELKGQSAELQRRRLIELGITPEEVEAAIGYIEDPKCGELGQEVLRKFADDGPPAFAVGFVSVAAGLLLARHWIRFALFGPAAVTPSDRCYLSINFYNGRCLWHEEKLKDQCDCKERTCWQSLWEP